MKISRTGLAKSSPLRRADRRPGASASGFAEHLSGARASSETHAVRGPRAAGGVDSLLSVQELGDALGREGEARQRAENILDGLDELRHGLLSGGLSRPQVEKVACLVRARRGVARDPRLIEILDQIELRAEIELAKYATLD